MGNGRYVTLECAWIVIAGVLRRDEVFEVVKAEAEVVAARVEQPVVVVDAEAEAAEDVVAAEVQPALHLDAEQIVDHRAVRPVGGKRRRTRGRRKLFSKCGDLYIVSYVFRHAEKDGAVKKSNLLRWIRKF